MLYLYLLGLLITGTFASVQPIVGILTAPVDGEVEGSEQFFYAFYVKWLEMSGLGAAVIPYNAPQTDLDKYINNLNGILFTGGSLSLLPNTTYYKTAKYLYEGVIASNQRGEHMPLWGTCMGFQLLNILTSGNWSILDRNVYLSENQSLPLSLTSSASHSHIFGQMPEHIVNIFAHENVTVNLHHDGLPPNSFKADPHLNQFYRMIATNQDRVGREYVSFIEAYEYPIYGVQFHPERNQFEWINLDINHDADAISAMQYLGNFLASEVRKSQQSHEWTDPSALIYNYSPISDPPGSSHQVYNFNFH